MSGNPAASPRRRRLLAPPGVIGALVAVVFAWRSLLPTLMPRAWLTQAVITALCVALGYLIGALIAAVGTRLAEFHQRVPGERVRRIAWSVTAGGAAIVVLLALIGWPRWQNQQRGLLGMDHLSAWSAVPMLILAAMLTMVLGLIGRVIGRGVGALNRFTHRHLPPSLAAPATVLLVLLIGGALIRDVAAQRFTSWANSAFGTVDTSTTPGTVQPTGPQVSGSPESLAPWDTLGQQGRDFVAGATSRELLAAFHGPEAELREPVRVYAGLRSASNAPSRARLAVAELDRTGAWDREVLVVTTVTGTGWVDPDAARAVEVLHGGDTAIVAMQYSYLPSWISMVVDADTATEAGATLYQAVHEAWSARPESDRPQLVSFGQSLGSFGAEAAFHGVTVEVSIANLRTFTQGALFTGPTNDNPIWRQLLDARDPGSPVWRPVIDGGEAVRFANSASDLVELDPDWAEPRVLYVQHSSDPVTFWGMDWLLSAPDWMAQPRGPDVPKRGGWFPVVTWVQGVFDLMAGFAAPPGHGHDYSPVFAGAWAQITTPDGWTESDTERLAAFLTIYREDHDGRIAPDS